MGQLLNKKERSGILFLITRKDKWSLNPIEHIVATPTQR